MLSKSVYDLAPSSGAGGVVPQLPSRALSDRDCSVGMAIGAAHWHQGYASNAESNGSVAEGHRSVAEGHRSVAEGHRSVAEGHRSIDIPHSLAAESSSKSSSVTPPIKILMLDLSETSRSCQFVSLTAAVFFFYLLYGYVQELIFSIVELKQYGWYITLVQFACYSTFALTEQRFINRDTHRRIPMSNYVVLSFLTVATMGFSNSALGYLNYPTQVIFKCCKLIPVLIGGYFIQGKKYGVLDVTACLCMSVGLILFTLADSTVSPNFNAKGILFISLALTADAAIGNVQEKVMKRYQGSAAEMVLYSYSMGFIYLLLATVSTGEILSATHFCIKTPSAYVYILLFSITGYLGINVVLTLVKSFGALTAVTVTTGRKAVTIILSFIFFTKPFTMQYVWSGMIVVAGIYMNVYAKQMKSARSTSDHPPSASNLISRVSPLFSRISPLFSRVSPLVSHVSRLLAHSCLRHVRSCLRHVTLRKHSSHGVTGAEQLV